MPRKRIPPPRVLSPAELLAAVIAERYTPIPPHRVLAAHPKPTYAVSTERRDPAEEYRFAIEYAKLLGDTPGMAAARQAVLETGMSHVPDAPVPAWRLRALVTALIDHYGSPRDVGDVASVPPNLIGRIRGGTAQFTVSQQTAAALLAAAHTMNGATA